MDSEERILYPMKFIPVPGIRVWGGDRMVSEYGKKLFVSEGRRRRMVTAGDNVGECYDVADLGYVDSMIDNGWFGGNTIGDLMKTYLERVVGEKSFGWYGTQFPVTVKWIDARRRTPLTVNPDDETAEQRYDAFGRTALWYVAEAGPGAALYLGFADRTDAGEFYSRCADGSVAELLNVVRPKKGDSFLISPGTVHAAEDVVLVEVSEASGISFAVHDWGGEGAEENTALQLEEAFDIIDFGPYRRCGEDGRCRHDHHDHHEHHDHDEGHGGPAEKLSECAHFTVSEIRLQDPMHIYSGRFDSFLLYVCVEGSASLQFASGDGKGTEQFVLRKGETALVPAEVPDFFLLPLEGGTVLIEAGAGVIPDAEEFCDEPGHHHDHICN